jgi:hypothetical protein
VHEEIKYLSLLEKARKEANGAVDIKRIEELEAFLA